MREERITRQGQATETGTAEIGAQAPAPARVERKFPQAFASLRHRNYQLWFGGQLVSVIGTWMQIIAQSWLVYQISRSEFALGLVSFASAIPVLIISPWGGVIVDRVPKRTLLVITQSTTMLMAFLLSALAFLNIVQVWHIVAMAAVLGCVNAFDAPARQALVVDIVERVDIPNAIALNSMVFNGARVLGPAIGGLLLAAVGAAWCFLINGFSFIAVIAGLLAMRFPSFKPIPTRVNPWKEFMEGIHYARSRREIIGLLAVAAIFSVFGSSYSAILPAFITLSLNAGAAAYGVINAAIGAGAVVGALYIAQSGLYGKRGRAMMIANLAYPVVLALFAYNTLYAAALVLSFGLGLGFMLLLNNANSLLQITVDDAMRGRVMSFYMLSFFGLAPFGSLAIGAVAEALPLNLTIALSALITLALAALVYAKVPELKQMR